MVVTMQRATSIVYFDQEGRQNLLQVLRVVKKALRKRADLRALKLVIFTAEGEGPALALNQLEDFDPKIIAVTFPPDFSVLRGGKRYFPRIPDKLRRFFNAVGVTVLTSRLPFDRIEGAELHSQQLDCIRKTLSIFGGGFSLCAQAVLQSCDHGEVGIGEKVIALSGDCAAVITASDTKRFLTNAEGLAVNEILCKPRVLDITRAQLPGDELKTGELFPSKPPVRGRAPIKALPVQAELPGKK